jgi:hypothetical protein
LHDIAYYIFLKSSRSVEEFRKNSNIKIHSKSPCTIFQSLCKFKNLIFIPKGTSFSFQPSWPNRPTGVLGLLAHTAQPAFLPPPTPKQGTPPRRPCAAPASPCHVCTNPLLPPSIRGVKHQLRVSRFIPINAGHSSALITTLPLSPYIKGELRRSPPHLSPLSFSSLRAQAPPAPSASSTISSPLSPAPR